MTRIPSRFAVRAMRTAISPRLAMRTEENIGSSLTPRPDRKARCRTRLSSGRDYCLAFGLSDSGAEPPDGCFPGGGRRAADAGAELVGWAEGDEGGAAAWLGGGAGGSAFMMLTGGGG